MIERVVVAGGGTGGHLFPGMAVVEELRRRNPQVSVLFVGTERGIEARVLPERGEELALLPVRPLKGQGALRAMVNAVRLPASAFEAMSVLRRHRPQVVIGLGGYAAGPVLAAAATMRIPTALLEQNAHVGLTNRMLSHVVGRAYLTYEETAALFGDKRARVVGNPVRRDFVEAAHLANLDPMGAEARAKQIFVLGGSQGARCLNELVPEALAQANIAKLGIRVLHQTGTAMLKQVATRYQELGIDAEVVSFIDDMARAYGSASLLIARAGATTLAELCAIGRPSLLIPFPYAAEDHQMKNAQALAAKGAAVVLAEQGLAAETLANQIGALMQDHERRREMASAARALGRPDAAAAIVDDLYEWLGFSQEQHQAASQTAKQDMDNEGEDGIDTAATRRLGVRRQPRVRRGRLRVQPVDGLAQIVR